MKKAMWVVNGVFAPEAVVFTACVQLRTALDFRRKLEKVLRGDNKRDVDSNAGSNEQKGKNGTTSRVTEETTDAMKGPQTADNPAARLPNTSADTSVPNMYGIPSIVKSKLSSINNDQDGGLGGLGPLIHSLTTSEGEGKPTLSPSGNIANKTPVTETFTNIPDFDTERESFLDLNAYRISRQQSMTEEEAFPNHKVPLIYAWYVVMGGFTIDVSPLHDYYDVVTITHHGILALAKRGLFLQLRKESIKDKSKADFLAKGLVFIQVLFLIVQVSARKAEGLPISLLEIHTLVHVVCALSMYVTWWGKPLGIKDPTRIDSTVWGNPSPEEAVRWQSCIASMLVLCTWFKSWDVIDSELQPISEAYYARNFQDKALTQSPETRIGNNPKPTTEIRSGHALPPGPTREKCPTQAELLSRRDQDPLATIKIRSGKSICGGVGPEYNGADSDFQWLFTERALKRWIFAFSSKSPTLINVPDRDPDSKSEWMESPYFERIIPNFFAHSYKQDRLSIWIAWSTCFVYGGIHATAWNFTFPSAQERLLWRISCPILVAFGVPVAELIRYALRAQAEGWRDVLHKVTLTSWYPLPHRRSLFHMFGAFILPFYIAARIFLVIEAFISLRRVPVGVYSAVSWALNVPHL